MKIIALILLFGLSGAAAAGYKEAESALKNTEVREARELDALLAQPGAALAKDARAAALLADNRQALELFRQAAEAPNEGYLFAPKPEKLSFKTPAVKFGAHVKLIKLILIDAKIKTAEKQAGSAEKDLLAAAGFIAQLSSQKSGVLLSSMVQQLCLLKTYPVLAESMRGTSARPAYLKELAARLEKIAENQDYMRAAMIEEAETAKGTMRENVSPAGMVIELGKLSPVQRLGAKKLQDQEFFSTVYGKYNAAVDEHAKVLIAAFRANDPSPVGAYLNKRQREILARKQARDERSTFSGLIDGMKGGPEAKKEMGDIVVDTMLNMSTPSYEKIIPRYHLFFCELNVLRAALAVKLYQRGSRRLPDSLDQFAPSLLAAVPQDSFNKFGPVKYVKTGRKFLVYSFGPDGADGKGAASLDYEAYLENPARSAGDILFAD